MNISSFSIKPKVYIPVILAVLLTAGIIWWWFAREKKHKDAISSRDIKIAALQVKWLECINAPADTVFVPRVIVLPPSDIEHPTPKKIIKPAADSSGILAKDSASSPVIPAKDPSIVENKDSSFAAGCPQAYYNDTIKKDNYSVNIEAMGCIKWWRVLGITLDYNYMIIKRNQVLIQHDTAWLPTKPPTFRWGPYVGLTLNSFSKFPGIEVGAQAVVKNQLTISGGGLILDGIYANIRFGWLFNK